MEENLTFKIPNCLTKFAETKVAVTPMKAHNPLKPPIIDGLRPVRQYQPKIKI